MRFIHSMRAFLLVLFCAGAWLLPVPVRAGASQANPIVYYCVLLDKAVQKNILYISNKEENIVNGERLTFNMWNMDTESNVPWRNDKTSTNLIGMKVIKGDETIDGGYLAPPNITDWFNSVQEHCATIDLTWLDTSHVTTMENAFYETYCETLTFGPKFDTSHVSSMKNMFYECQANPLKLAGDDTTGFAGFDTSAVTNMLSMLAYTKAAELDVTTFDTSKVTDMGHLFNNAAATGIVFGNGFDTSKVTNMVCMFQGLHVKDFKVPAMSIDSNPNMYNLFRKCHCESIEFPDGFVFPTTINGLVVGCHNLKTLDLSKCKISGTGKVSVGSLVADAESLTSVNLSCFDTAKMTATSNMFERTFSLVEITVGENWKLGCFPGSPYTSWCNSNGDEFEITTENPTPIPSGVADTYKIKPPKMIYWKFDSENKTLSIVSGIPEEEDGTDYQSFSTTQVFAAKEDVPWNAHRGNIESVSIRAVNGEKVTPWSMAYWFTGCSKLTFVDNDGLDSSQVTSMVSLFQGCTVLEENILDDGTVIDNAGLANLGTTKVVKLTRIFSGCNAFIRLDFTKPSWKFKLNGTYGEMNSGALIFESCAELEYLDISNWNLNQTADLHSIFYGCKKLKDLFLPPNWATPQKIQTTTYQIYSLFYNNKALTELKLGSMTGKPSNECYFLYGCSALKRLDISNLTLEKYGVEERDYHQQMFAGCDSLEWIKVGNGFSRGEFTDCPIKYWDAYLVDEEWDGFPVDEGTGEEVRGGKVEGSPFVSGSLPQPGIGQFYVFTPVEPNRIYWKVENRVLTIGTDPSMYDPGDGGYSGYVLDNSGSAPGWLKLKANIEKVVTECSQGKAAPQNAGGWFSGLSKCTELDLSSLDLSRCVSMSSMFAGNGMLESVTWPGDEFLPSEMLERIDSMFSGCKALKSMDLSGFDASGVSDLSKLFNGCSALEELNLSGKFSPENCISFDGMLGGCTSLYRLNLSQVANSKLASYGLSDTIPGCIGYTDAASDGTEDPSTGKFIPCGSINLMQQNAGPHDWRVILTATVDKADGSEPTVYETLYGGLNSEFFLVSDPSRTGYKFLHWENSDEDELSSSEVNALTVEKTDTYTALWEANTYKITLDLVGGTSSDDNPIEYTIETEAFSLDEPEKTGYLFQGWTKDDEVFDPEHPVKTVTIEKGATGDFTYHAHWAPIQYTIVFKSNYEGGAADVTEADVLYDTNVTLVSRFERENYSFTRWTDAVDADSSTHTYDKNAVVSNLASTDGATVILYAQWIGDGTHYTFRRMSQSLDPDGDNVVDWAKDYNGTIGDTVTIADLPPKNGFNTPEKRFVTLTEPDQVIDYVYTRKDYGVALTAGTGVESVSVEAPYKTAGERIRFEDNVTVTVALKDGYKWDTESGSGWTATAGSLPFDGKVQSPAFPMPDMEADLAATVNATAIEFTIRCDKNDPEELHKAYWPEDKKPMESYTVEMAEDYTLPNPARDGYDFTGWSGTGLVGEENMTVTITKGSQGDRNYVAHWQLHRYDIVYKRKDGTVIKFSDTDIDIGGAVDSYQIIDADPSGLPLVVAKQNGYEFIGWYRSADFSGEKWDAVPSGTHENLDLFGKFDPLTYGITYELEDDASYPADNSGNNDKKSFTVEKAVALAPASRKVPGTDVDAYDFQGWYTGMNGTGTNYYPNGIPVGTFVPATETDPNPDLVLYAYWTLNTFDIAYNDCEGAVNENDPTYTVKTVQFYAKHLAPPSKSGFVFVGWTDDNVSGDVPELDKTIDVGACGDRSFTAHWKKDEVRVHHDGADAPEVVSWIALDAKLKDSGRLFDVTMPVKGVYGGVTSGYLYGGMWTDDRKAALRSDVCGKALEIPALDELDEAGMDIYVREVPDTYAKPFQVSYSNGGFYHTIVLAPADVADDAMAEMPYKGAGFLFTDGEGETTRETAELYGKVVIHAPAGDQVFDAKKCGCADGMSVYALPVSDVSITDWTEAGEPVGLEAFYITMDDVKVYAASRKTMAFHAPGKPEAVTTDCASRTEDVRPVSFGVERLPMLRMASFSLGDAGEDQAVLVLHVDGLECRVSGQAGGDLRELAGTPVLEGSLFAGWFLDGDFSEPADFGRLENGTELYARFVSAEGLLDLDARPATAGGRLLRLRLISACDEAAFSCGFLVECAGRVSTVSASRYRAVDGTTAEALFGASEDASLFYCDLPAASLKGAGELRATPFWTTPDGSRVFGKAVTVSLEK